MSLPLPSLTFKIAKLWGSPEGTTDKIKIDTLADFEKHEIDQASPLKADLLFIKLKNEISTLVSNASLKVYKECSKCLAKFELEVKIPSAERQFLPQKPSKAEDYNDIFLIDMKAMTVSLYEMFRQEIILHFPLIAVCSGSCKGLCQYCGKNRNKVACQCKTDNIEILHQPFKNLKKLLS